MCVKKRTGEGTQSISFPRTRRRRRRNTTLTAWHGIALANPIHNSVWRLPTHHGVGAGRRGLHLRVGRALALHRLQVDVDHLRGREGKGRGGVIFVCIHT